MQDNKQDDINSLALENQLLIATPYLSDPTFRQSVIYVCKVDEHSVMGIAINKPTQHMLSDLLRSQNIPFDSSQVEEHPILLGGPVSKEQGFIIHSTYPFNPYCPTKGLKISTSKDLLQDIAQGSGPEHLLISLGYTSWRTEQLVKEMVMENYWLVAPANEKIIFNTSYSIIWQMAAASIGVNFNYFSTYSGHS